MNRYRVSLVRTQILDIREVLADNDGDARNNAIKTFNKQDYEDCDEAVVDLVEVDLLDEEIEYTKKFIHNKLGVINLEEEENAE